jgi:outer membrane protein assembly factor BamB
MLAAVACGPTVADIGADAATTQTDDPDIHEGAAAEDGDVTVGSSDPTDLDTGSVEPIDCPTPGACDADCTQWEQDYQGPAGVADQFAAIAIGPDGTIIAAGMRDWVQDVGAGDLIVVGYSAAGDQLWELTPLGVDNGAQDGASDVAVGSDGTIAVIGSSAVPGTIRHGVLVLLDSARSDPRIYEYAVDTELTAVAFAPDGTVIVAGAGGGASGPRFPFLHRLDDAGFDREWLGDEFDLPSGVVLGMIPISPSVIALAGATDGLGNSDVWLAALDFDDGLSWSTIHDGDPTTNQWADDLAVLPDGDLFVVGAEHDSEGNGLAWAGRFGPDGSTRWTRNYPGTGCCANALDGVEISDDGRVFVLGVRGGTGLRIKLQELDCNGEIAWEWNHESPGWDTSFSGGLAWSSELGLIVGGSDYLSMSDQRGFVARIGP